LSATVEPVETAARLLVGAAEPPPAVVDSGHRRRLELSLELPDGELEAAISGDQMGEILDRIRAHVANHRTTLVFVNTRKLRSGWPMSWASGWMRTSWRRIMDR
jgi:ATP-dependent Lhr-like helicase